MFFRLLMFVFLAIFAVFDAEAKTYYFQNTTLGQGREDLRGRQEFPIESYVQGRYQATKWRAETGFKVFRDWERKNEDVDLFEANLYGKLLENRLEVVAGRQFFTPGFNTFLMDGVNLDIHFSPKVGLGIYGGVPRYPETGDFKQDNDLLSGLQLLWKKIGGLTGNTSIVYLRKDFGREDWVENDQLSVAQYFVYDGEKAERFRPYLGLEYQVSGKVLKQIQSGLNWHPKRILSFNLEFNLFDENRQEIKETLTAFHADGRIYQGRFGSRQKITRDLEVYQNYTFSRFNDSASRMGNAHQLEVGFDYLLWPIQLRMTPGYALTDSYGGRAHRAFLGLEKEFRRVYSVALHNHYVSFNKVTNDNGKAFGSLLWAGWSVSPQWTLGAHAEFLKSNDVEREWRSGFLLQWNLGQNVTYPRTMKGVLAL